MGASQIFAVDRNPFRLKMARDCGATYTIETDGDPVGQILRATRGRGVDVSIEALGTSATFEQELAALKPGGTLSSVGVYSGHLRIPLESFGGGLADKKIATTLCPGGKSRMARLMRLVEAFRIDLSPLLTHRFRLDQIGEAYSIFAGQKDNVLKVAIDLR